MDQRKNRFDFLRKQVWYQHNYTSNKILIFINFFNFVCKLRCVNYFYPISQEKWISHCITCLSHYSRSERGWVGGVLHSLTYSDLADQSHFKPSVPFTLVGQYSVGPFYFWKVHLLMTVKSIVSTLYYQSLKQRYFSKFNFSMLHYQSHPRLNKGISLSLIITWAGVKKIRRIISRDWQEEEELMEFTC